MFSFSRFQVQVQVKTAKMFKAAVPRARKIKLAEFSGFATLGRSSCISLAVLERDAARQNQLAEKPTVLVRLSG
jgi:hypothetical protein